MSLPEFTLLPDGLPAGRSDVAERFHQPPSPRDPAWRRPSCPRAPRLEAFWAGWIRRLQERDLRRTTRQSADGSHAPRPRPAAGAGYSRRAWQSGQWTTSAGRGEAVFVIHAVELGGGGVDRGQLVRHARW